ncbi:MAG: uncharacterized protein QOC64_105 [Solirubrobacteraceae bacterium]|nr:uncharacterized protein [Solirubrobacteraceae bacterium]
MRCPSCDSRLVELERSEILIDACPECRGVWLDRGELDRLLEKERRTLAHGDADDNFFAEMSGRREQPQPRHDERHDRDRDRDRDYKKPKKRKSLLEDLLDF